jgi:hypothetical protein
LILKTKIREYYTGGLKERSLLKEFFPLPRWERLELALSLPNGAQPPLR